MCVVFVNNIMKPKIKRTDYYWVAGFLASLCVFARGRNDDTKIVGESTPYEDVKSNVLRTYGLTAEQWDNGEYEIDYE